MKKQPKNNQTSKQTNNQGDLLNQKQKNKVIAQDKINTYVHSVTQTAVNSYLDK